MDQCLFYKKEGKPVGLKAPPLDYTLSAGDRRFMKLEAMLEEIRFEGWKHLVDIEV